MRAYDFDGVLAVGPPPPAKAWGKMRGPERQARRAQVLAHYGAARPLLRVPTARPFVVITARRNTPDVAEASWAWLRRHYGDACAQLYLLDVGRTLENVVAHKLAALRNPKATDFTEDNTAVVRGLYRAGAPCRLWVYRRGMATLYQGAAP